MDRHEETELAQRKLVSILNKVPASAMNGSVQEAVAYKDWLVKAQKLAKKRGVAVGDINAAINAYRAMDKERLL